jgi:hypothetical protein
MMTLLARLKMPVVAPFPLSVRFLGACRGSRDAVQDNRIRSAVSSGPSPSTPGRRAALQGGINTRAAAEVRPYNGGGAEGQGRGGVVVVVMTTCCCCCCC